MTETLILELSCLQANEEVSQLLLPWPTYCIIMWHSDTHKAYIHVAIKVVATT